jgi:hypothetical protein
MSEGVNGREEDTGTATLVYPSSEAPEFTHFSMDYPAGWRTQVTPGFLALVIDPKAINGFHANIGIGAVHIPIETTLEMASKAALDEAVDNFRDFSVTREEPSSIGGQPAAMRLQSFYAEEIGQLVGQLQLLFFAPDPSPDEGQTETRQLFRIHATCLADSINDYAWTFVNAARSFRFLDQGGDSHDPEHEISHPL